MHIWIASSFEYYEKYDYKCMYKYLLDEVYVSH